MWYRGNVRTGLRLSSNIIGGVDLVPRHMGLDPRAQALGGWVCFFNFAINKICRLRTTGSVFCFLRDVADPSRR